MNEKTYFIDFDKSLARLEGLQPGQDTHVFVRLEADPSADAIAVPAKRSADGKKLIFSPPDVAAVALDWNDWMETNIRSARERRNRG